MPRTKGSKNRPKINITKDYASQIAEKQESIVSLTAEIECEPIRVDDYTGKKMTFFHDPDGLPLELHE